MCKQLNGARAGYYKWINREKPADELENEQSMSRVGCCIDNGSTEGFWGIIKSEMYYISDFCNEEELRQAIDEYIDYYNNYRYQERYDNLAHY